MSGGGGGGATASASVSPSRSGGHGHGHGHGRGGHSSRRDVWSPAPTRETFKDLLIFEERLKQNAERLQKQRRKYEAFLISLSLLIVYFAYKVFVLPSIYSLVHYFNVALLLVSLVTLALFFATGIYSEKIAYAYRFVPQANRALRPLNIYLNTRKRSWVSYLSLFRFAASPPVAVPPSVTPIPKPSSPSSPSSPTHTPPSSSPATSDTQAETTKTASRRASVSSATSSTSSDATIRSSRAMRSPPPSRSPSPPATSSIPHNADPVTRTSPPTTIRRSPSQRAPSGVPLPPIPPAQNPRGELIFSSRVAPQFREGYEKYRAEWERRRIEASAQGTQGWISLGWLRRNSTPPISSTSTISTGGAGEERNGRPTTTMGRKRTGSAASSRQVSPARSTASSTTNSRKSSPVRRARSISTSSTPLETSRSPSPELTQSIVEEEVGANGSGARDES